MIRTYMDDRISRDADSMVVRLRWNLTARSRIELSASGLPPISPPKTACYAVLHLRPFA